MIVEGGGRGWSGRGGRGIRLKSLDLILEALGSYRGCLSRGVFYFRKFVMVVLRRLDLRGVG